jgi:hypothetical protein
VLNPPPDLSNVAAGGAHRSVVPVVAAMIALAGLDLIGAVFARSWADHRSMVSLVGGLVAFGLLFVVYGKSLDYVELSTVTIGWVVLLQVGVMALDRLNGVVISTPRLGAIGLILVLQAYLTVSGLAE